MWAPSEEPPAPDAPATATPPVQPIPAPPPAANPPTAEAPPAPAIPAAPEPAVPAPAAPLSAGPPAYIMSQPSAPAFDARAVAAAGWVLTVVILVAAGWGVVAKREQIMRAWPNSERAYAALGLHR
jgi:outer membrane biosynthesis protein TonB